MVYNAYRCASHPRKFEPPTSRRRRDTTRLDTGHIEKGGGNLYTLWVSVRVQPSVRAVLELWEQSASIWPAHVDEDAMGEEREWIGI